MGWGGATYMGISFEDIISLENLLLAWQEFVKGKRHKRDVQEFGRSLIDNLLGLHHDLRERTYRHGGYEAFPIADPKPRRIHKASVRDRLLHHALCRRLYLFFDRLFVADSFSCRKGKGVHKALRGFQRLAWQVSRNNTQTAWILKCDIKKFFDSIHHDTLLQVLAEKIEDQRVLALLRQVIDSFHATPGNGLPLGNLTSQLLVNIYMNEFDQFVKHSLNVKHYVRYADDFVVLSPNRIWLRAQLKWMQQFLWERLRLSLHPDKLSITTLASGVDFLGWVHFPNHRTLRTRTSRRMKVRLREHPTQTTLQSYLGLLRHGATGRLQADALNNYWLWKVGEQ